MDASSQSKSTDYDYYLKGCAVLGWNDPLPRKMFTKKYTSYVRLCRELTGHFDKKVPVRMLRSFIFNVQMRNEVSRVGKAVIVGKGEDDYPEGTGVGARPVPPPPTREGAAARELPCSLREISE
jgi:hypothetical protein